MFVKGTADTNAAALDKCLEALQTFLEKANESHATRHVLHATAILLQLSDLLSSKMLTLVRYHAELLVQSLLRLHPRSSNNALALFREQRMYI